MDFGRSREFRHPIEITREQFEDILDTLKVNEARMMRATVTFDDGTEVVCDAPNIPWDDVRAHVSKIRWVVWSGRTPEDNPSHLEFSNVWGETPFRYAVKGLPEDVRAICTELDEHARAMASSFAWLPQTLICPYLWPAPLIWVGFFSGAFIFAAGVGGALKRAWPLILTIGLVFAFVVYGAVARRLFPLACFRFNEAGERFCKRATAWRNVAIWVLAAGLALNVLGGLALLGLQEAIGGARNGGDVAPPASSAATTTSASQSSRE